MADYLRHGARAPTLVGRHELGGGSQCKRWNHLEAERGRVVVEDEEDHVRLLIFQPLLREVVAFEYRLPIWLGGLAEVERRADRRHVGGVDAGRYPGHHFFSPMRRVASLGGAPPPPHSRGRFSVLPGLPPAP